MIQGVPALQVEPVCISVSVVVRNRIEKMWSSGKDHLAPVRHTTSDNPQRIVFEGI
jgi:hypothetical protein